MKIAVYQGASCEGDIDRAYNAVKTTLLAASIAGVKMIVFPELFLPGYNQPALHRSMAQPQAGPWEKMLSNMARENACGLTIGWAEREGEAIFNSVSCFDEFGNKICQHRKLQLFGSIEKSTFACGENYQTFTLHGIETAILICYDVEFAHHVQALKEKGVELLIVPTANPESYNNVPEYLVPARAVENRLTIAYANYCGEEDGLVYGGKSLVVGPDGEALVKAGKGETLMIVDLETVKAIDATLLSTQHEDRRTVLSG